MALGESVQSLHRHCVINVAKDLEEPTANQNGTILEAVTKDQINTGMEGQIRYRVSERNLYAYLFGVKKPVVHVMGYFVSVLREHIAAFEAPRSAIAGNSDDVAVMAGISIFTTIHFFYSKW